MTGGVASRVAGREERPVTRTLLVVAVALLALGGLFAAPAAGHTPGAAWERPEELADGGRLEVTAEVPELAARFTHEPEGRFRVDAGWAVATGSSTAELEGCTVPAVEGVPRVYNGRAEVRFDLGAPEFPCNGLYAVAVEAEYEDTLHETASARLTAELAVAVPAARPEGVRADVDAPSRTVVVRWDANREADLLGYGVERARGDGKFELLGTSEDEVYFDEELPGDGGTYRYRVVAVRPGAEEEDEVVLSESSSAATAEVPPEPTTTTTTSTTAPQDTTSTSPPTTSAARDAGGASGFDDLRARARRPAPRSQPPTTVDTGYEDTLPFAAPSTTKAPTTTAPPDRTGLAIVEYDGEQGPGTPDLLAPAAGALALTVGAVHLRWLVKRASS